MNREEIMDTLYTEPYSFLRDNEHLGDNIVLLTLSGSLAYGTNVEGSDLDLRGVALERPVEVIGLEHFDQVEDKGTDTTIYAFRKFVNLLVNANPNVLEMLGTKDEHIFILSYAGKLLKDNVDLFLSKRCISSFGGYASAQLKRLQNALARDSYPQEEKEKHIMVSIENQMRHLEQHYSDYTKSGELKIYLDKSEKEDHEYEIFMDIRLKHYPLRDFKNIYSEMHEVVKTYGKLNHRNRKKDEESLLKHAMHLIRLLEMGTEILEGKGVNTFRGNREFLLDIRNGKYSYEELFDLANDRDKVFKYASDNTSLPKNPNYKKINELVMVVNTSGLDPDRRLLI